VTVQSQKCAALTFSAVISNKSVLSGRLTRVRPVHSLKVFQLSSNVNCHPILQ